MNKLSTLTLSLLLSVAGPALAHETGSAHGHDAAASSKAAKPLVEAVVRTVDKSAKKITLRHGEIPNLDMGPMTMVFQVQDPALLDKVKPGDNVRFTADQIKGAYTVLTIEPVQK
ncbi:MAG: copper-binding protein [Burkholderiales bacterium]|nr:copper-binding protein [Burkholderiales bacterium]